MSLNRRSPLLAGALPVASCVVFTLATFLRQGRSGVGFPSCDIYGAHYANVIYALRSLSQGHGILWNSLQNCGQPFIPSTLVGLFYPANLLFLVFDIDAALLVSVGLHLSIAALGAYALCRELGLSRPSAVIGGVGFGLNGMLVANGGWQPVTILGPHAFMPVAAWLCERILKRPTIPLGLGLGAVIALQLLGGYPQMVLFTGLFIASRTAWQLASPRAEHRAAALLVLGLAFAAALVLASVQLLPMIEMARASVRSGPLAGQDVAPNPLTLASFRSSVEWHWPIYGTAFTVVGCALALAGFASKETWRAAAFHGVLFAIFLLLVFDTPLQRLYTSLPVGALFRYPERFLWVAALPFAVLGAFGAESILKSEPPHREARLLPALGIGALAFAALELHGLQPWEWLLVLVLGACPLLARAAIGRRFLPATLFGVLLCNHFTSNWNHWFVIPRSGAFLSAYEKGFAVVQSRRTYHDRVFTSGHHGDYALSQKTPQIYGLAGATDYEPQTSRRFAELTVNLALGPQVDLTTLGLFYFYGTGIPVNRPLLNLLAVRFLVVDARNDKPGSVLSALGAPLWEKGPVRVYENPEAWPRAFYVSRLRVAENAAAAHHAVAAAGPELHDVAIVEEAPRGGFIGSPGGRGGVAITSDAGEDLVVSVATSQAGFIVLSDQYYPGWEATVNDVPTPVLRANYAFRAVRVPAGKSTVAFRYRPLSVRLGAALTSCGLLASGLYLAWFVRRRRENVESE